MGSVHAGSFVRAMLTQDPDVVVHELCPKCATFFANTILEGDDYPQPPPKNILGTRLTSWYEDAII